MTLLLLTLALALGYAAAWFDQRKRRPKTSEWWAGWQVGRDHGFQAGRLSRAEREGEP